MPLPLAPWLNRPRRTWAATDSSRLPRTWQVRAPVAGRGGMQDLDKLLDSALSEVTAAQDLALLDQVRVQYLGKKGELTQLLKQLGGGKTKMIP